MSNAPGQLGGRKLERMRKGDLFEHARNARDCDCTQARVMRELLRRQERRESKRLQEAA